MDEVQIPLCTLRIRDDRADTTAQSSDLETNLIHSRETAKSAYRATTLALTSSRGMPETRGCAAIALAIGFLVAPVRIAQAAVSRNDSPAFAVPTTNCITQNGEPLGSARVGWLGDPASPPPVNTVYYVRVWWGLTGKPCIGGARVAPELFLPDGRTLAISAATPVKCLARNFTTGVSTPELTACRQTPSAGVRGGRASTRSASNSDHLSHSVDVQHHRNHGVGSREPCPRRHHR